MKIGIVGAGAMGSLFGARLALAGADVALVDVNKDHVEAIQKHGLVFDEGAGPRQVKISATTKPAEIGLVDLIVLFCKHRQTRVAVAGAQPMVGPQTYLLTLQNGIGNLEIIAETVQAERIIKGLTSVTAILNGAGHVSTNFQGQTETYVWPMDGNQRPILEEIVTQFTQAGLPTFPARDIDYRIWRKLVINASLTVLSAAANVGIGPIGETEPGKRLLREIVAEVVAVAQAKGIPLKLDDATSYMEELRKKAFDHIGSTTVDLQAGRLTEIDAMCGAVSREGAKLGVSTPANHVISEFVRVIEATRPFRLPVPI